MKLLFVFFAIFISLSAHAANFSCVHDTCNSNQQYCLVSNRIDNSDAIFFYECRPKPANCNTCDCYTSDAKAAYPNVENCKHWVTCNINNGKVEVRCSHNF